VAELQTQRTEASVGDFLASVPDEARRKDAVFVCDLMQEVTGEEPVMWGPAIVGFGNRVLVYPNGRKLDWMRIAFSPRKQGLTLYVFTEAFTPESEVLSRLGKHTTGRGCLYIKKLTDVDTTALREVIESAYKATE